ncbi:MAG: AraC family transcriptional regulator [Lachnospiraceae bacterium]|nr:AraC family transcriptional regulator [Lachnospiraceae bacterium]
MYALYRNSENEFEIYRQKSVHHPPHISSMLECIYITEGTLELGVYQSLFHMEKGDFAIVFPDVIHHYQVFDTGKCSAIHLLASPMLSGQFLSVLTGSAPEDPVIKAADLHPDISYAMTNLQKDGKKGNPEKYADILHESYLRIILSRALPCYTLTEKTSQESDDIIDRVVSYIARHFMENISLTSMAEALYVSPYSLSRVFSGTFHTNFNKYLNQTRLRYVVYLLKHTDQSITEAYLNAGFESQRTFNRAFQETYRMSPRDYRKMVLQKTE